MKRFSPYFYNWISYAGAVLALLVFIAECFLFTIDFFAHGKNLYLGLLTYIALPPLLIFGLLLIPAGALWKRHGVKHGRMPLHQEPLKIDFSIPTHRNAVLVFLVGTTALVSMTLVGAYKAFHYTESVQFCGMTCHQVMHPEYTTYQKSPHARVKCIDCHVGEGAEYYVKSKMAGTRQVYRVLTNTYKKPIDTPVRALRPAQETCERCHWPQKFFGTKDFRRTYFLSEGDEREWKLRMLMNVGGQNGVHAHMSVAHDMYYAAEDEDRQVISWVKSVDAAGNETVYMSDDSKYKDSPPPASAIRKMDCMDCHNRPSHRYEPPYRLVNELMRDGKIDPSIPEIKEQASTVLAGEYATMDEAMAKIPEKLTKYYAEKHPDFYANGAPLVDAAAAALKEVFSQNMFPDMKARWDKFPDNIGHLTSQGCFRCHDGAHRSTAAPERVITRDCNACHTIIEQGPTGSVERNIDGVPFRHPIDDDNGWRDNNCSDCHSGANP